MRAARTEERLAPADPELLQSFEAVGGETGRCDRDAIARPNRDWKAMSTGRPKASPSKRAVL